jgi:acyl-CoA thioester hydrolase
LTPNNSPDAIVSEARVRVRYAETDQMGVVYHSNYIIWFEIGRVELMRTLGYEYKQMEMDGIRLPVAEVRCRYKSPALYDDELVVRTRLHNVRGSLIRFGYEVVRESDKTLLAEGESTHIVANLRMERATLPEKYWAPFLKALGSDKGQ